MTSRDDTNARAYEDPSARKPIGPARLRADHRRLTDHVPVRFPKATIEAVRAFADEDGVTVSSWIRRLVDEEIERRVRGVSSTSASEDLQEMLQAFRTALSQTFEASSAPGFVTSFGTETTERDAEREASSNLLRAG